MLFWPLMMAALPAAAAEPSFADLADLTIASPVIVRAALKRPARLRAGEGNPPPGAVAALLSADVSAVLLSPEPVPPALQYIWTGPGTNGRAPAFAGRQALLFLADAKPATRLIDAGGQVDWSAETEASVRALLAELAQPGARTLSVTGVGSAFHTDGAVPGEAETQLFLTTADRRSISLAVLSRPGEAKRVVVATGEVIDESAPAVRPGTLLWYRLACFLPKALPDAAVAELAPADAAAARADYAAALTSFGSCVRARAKV